MKSDWLEDTDKIDPLSEETRSKLRHIDPRIDPRLLREMIVEKLLKGKALLSLTKAQQRTLDFKISLEYQHDLDNHVQCYQQKLDRQTDTEAREVILKAKEAEYANISLDDGDDDEQDVVVIIAAEIDRPIVCGGLTALHIACGEGDLDEVKRLIEKGARLDVKDAYGLSPLERAEMMGQVEVINYISKICHN